MEIKTRIVYEGIIYFKDGDTFKIILEENDDPKKVAVDVCKQLKWNPEDIDRVETTDKKYRMYSKA